MSEAHRLTAAYAMDALDDVERAGFVRHLRSCASCAAEVTEFQEVTARLAGRVMLAPPAQLRARVLAEASRTRQLPPSGWSPLHRPPLRRILATACAAALIAGSAGLAGATWGWHRAGHGATSIADQAAGRDAQIAAVMMDPSRSEVVQPVAAGGTAALVTAGRAAVLITRDLPTVPIGKTYQVWLFDPSGVHSVERLRLRDGSGQSLITGVSPGSSVAVSVEPAAAGSRRPTTEPVLTMLVA